MKSLLNFLSLKNVLIFFIFIVSIVKVPLANKGFLFFPDEGRYTQSGKALKALSEGKFNEAVTYVHSVQGRPLSAILHMIPSALQFITAKSTESSEIFSPKNSIWIFVYNIIVYIFLLFIIYKLVTFYTNQELGLLAALIYATLDSSFIYLRHALCYETALAAFLWVQYLIAKNEKSAIVLGSLNFCAYLIYPGYVLLFLFNSMFFIFKAFQFNKFVKRSTQFLLGILFTLAIAEAFSRIGSISFLSSSKTLSSTVKLGDFSQTFVFLFQFLTEVEGLRGIILIAGFISFPIILLLSKNMINHHLKNEFLFTYFGSVFLYCLYAFNGYFLHNSVFYARITHQFIPFLILLLCVLIFISIESKKYIKPIYIVLSVCFTLLYTPSIWAFYQLEYPKDIEYQLPTNANIYKGYEYDKKFYTINHRKIEYNSKDSLEYHPNLEVHSQSKPMFLTVNQAFFIPTDTIKYFRKIPIPKHFKEIFNKPHPLMYVGYQFEGHNLQSRKNLQLFQMRLKIYSK